MNDTQNAPIELAGYAPTDLTIQKHGLKRRRYMPKDKIIELAENKFNRNKSGITVIDVIAKGLAPNKAAAGDKLQRFRRQHVLFTPEKRKPQLYYASTQKAEVIEYLVEKKRNAPIDRIGASVMGDPLINRISEQRVERLVELLLEIGRNAPLGVHNIGLKLPIMPEYYEELKAKASEGNGGKVYTDVIDGVHVRFTFYRKVISVDITCTNEPFPIETDSDIWKLYGFLAVTRDKIKYIVSDSHGRIILPVDEWHWYRADLNKDKEITTADQLTLPDFQLKVKDVQRAFNCYVKIKNGKAYYRVEEWIRNNKTTVPEALKTFRGKEQESP